MTRLEECLRDLRTLRTAAPTDVHPTVLDAVIEITTAVIDILDTLDMRRAAPEQAAPPAVAEAAQREVNAVDAMYIAADYRYRLAGGSTHGDRRAQWFRRGWAAARDYFALATARPAAQAVTAEAVEAALKAERIAIGERLRQTASHYLPSSDGRNTFLMEAEWVESRTTVNQAVTAEMVEALKQIAAEPMPSGPSGWTLRDWSETARSMRGRAQAALSARQEPAP